MRLEKIQDTTTPTGVITATEAVHYADEDVCNAMDAWDNREELVDHIRDEAANLVMELLSKQSTRRTWYLLFLRLKN